MENAYILAGELKNCDGDYAAAFKNFQHMLYREIHRKQRMAEILIKYFVPRRKTSIWLRNKFTRMVFMPFLTKWAIKKFLMENISLKEY